MGILTHLVSLAVGAKDAEDHARLFQDISELSRNLAEDHDYVSVTSTLVGEDDEEDVEDEDLYHDHNTLVKVREALQRGVTGLTDDMAMDLIGEIQNAGILFRERR